MLSLGSSKSPGSPKSPRSSRGFQQILNSTNSIRNERMVDDGIALQTVRSHASSTGARRAQATASGVMGEIEEEMDEKEQAPHRHAGRRKKADGDLSRQNSGQSDDVSLNAMGRLYNKIVGFSVITRYLVYVAPVALLLAVPLIILPVTGHRNDVPVGNERDLIGPPLFQLFLWIEISWLSLWAGKTVAWALPGIFMFFCGVVSSGTKKYATVLRALEIPVSLFLWALVTWVVFINLFRSANQAGLSWVVTLGRILGATFVSSAVYLIEKAIVQLIGISYHQRSFANRINESKREIYLLGILYDASRALFPMYCHEFVEEDYIINDSVEMRLGGKSALKAGGAVTPMKLIGDVSRFGDKVTSVFGNIASEITGKKVFNPNSAHSIVLEALEKVRPSEALAKRIWMSFVVEGKDALYLEDVQEVLGPAYREDADDVFGLIDNDMNGDISLDEMIRKVVEIGKERKAVNEGMKDIGQALRVFDSVLLFVVVLIVVFIFLAFFQSSFISTLTTAGTALLSLSFVFAVTAQEFLGSCIFLFVKHPYDVGDRVDIVNSGEKVTLKVDKISLLYSVFTRIDKMQIVQIPNIQLNSVWIENVTRSKAMKELIAVNISFDTSLEDIELLRLEMESFVRHPDNSRDFQPDIVVGVGGVGDLDKLELKIAIKHKSNWHDEAVRASRRSKFMCALTLALKRIPINAPGGGSDALGSHTNPSYSVTVTDGFAAAGREQSEKEKDEKRLVPSKPAETEAEAETHEEKAADALNSQKPTAGAFDSVKHKDEEQQMMARQLTTRQSQRRSADIESLRLELKKSVSQSGRRKPGERVTVMTLGNENPAVGLTQPSPRSANFDEEARVGGGFGASYSTRQLGRSPSRSPSAAYRHDPPYQAFFPTSSRASPPPPPLQDEDEDQLHPLQSRVSVDQGRAYPQNTSRDLTPRGSAMPSSSTRAP